MRKSNKQFNWITTILIALFVVASCIVISIMLNGTTTTSGQYPEPEANQSLSCTSDSVIYPFFELDRASSRETKINIVFSANDKISSISLFYTLYYDSAESASGGESFNHAAMNKSFGANGLGHDAFSARYTTMEDGLSVQMSLFATSSDFDDAAKRYFLIDEDADLENIDYQKNYENQGFICHNN